VDQERFAQGMRNYRSGSFAAAAQDFLESAEPGIARGNGSAFHQAGNAFLQLERHKDALTMYQNALRDDTYDNMSAVYSNIGHVHAKEGNYTASAEAYELASTYPECEKPYKCFLRAAQNYMKLGSIDKAAIAYKKAALDVNNPARSKALYNLALCLLELKQPLSAVESLKLALDFPDCENRGQIFSTLGIAYSLLNSDEEAIESFDHARYIFGEQGLDPVAQAVYDAAKARLAMSAPLESIIEEPAIGIVEEEASSLTGEIQSIDTAGIDHTATVEPLIAVGSDEEIAQFFKMTEGELLEQEKELSLAGKQRMAWWKMLLWVLLALALLAALATGIAYYLGLGYPSANQVVYNALNAYGSQADIAAYWAAPKVEAEDAMADNVPRQAIFDIEAPSGRMGESTVKVTAVDAADHRSVITFTLIRDGLGWKIDNVTSQPVGEVTEQPASETQAQPETVITPQPQTGTSEDPEAGEQQ